MAQRVKNLPATQETQKTWVQSLCWEDPLEEEVATHSSILAWEIPCREEAGEKPPSLFLMLLLSELHQLPVLLFSCLISSCFYMAVFILSFLLCLSCLSISFSVLFF